MSSPARLCVGLGLAALLAGCHPEQTRWSDSATFADDSPDYKALLAASGGKPTVDVYSYATPPAPAGAAAKPAGILALSDRGQAALIDKLATAPPDKAKQLQSLLGPGPAAEGGGTPALKLLEENRFERTIVVSVSKGLAARPGDRLVKTTVIVTPSAPTFEFTGYTVPATDTRSQAIAHIDNKTAQSLSATLSPSAGGASATGSVSNASEGSADISQQYENLNLDIAPGRLRIVRESERGLDLSGNTLVTLTIATLPPAIAQTVMLASTLDIYAGADPKPPAAAAIAVNLAQYPPACDLAADVTLIYQMRLPDEAGRKYYLEGEQSPTFLSDVVTAKHKTLVRASEVAPKLYHLVDGRTGSSLFLQAGPAKAELAFADYLQAVSFAAWMNARHPATIGKNKDVLTVANQPFQAGSLHAVLMTPPGSCP